MKNESQEQESQWHEVTSLSQKSTTRHSHQIKKSEKAHVRKSLDARNTHSSNISGRTFNTPVLHILERYFRARCLTCDFHVSSDHFPAIDTAKKNLSMSSSHVSSSSATGSASGDKKTAGSHSIISSLKRLVSDVGNNNGVGNAASTISSSSECREELDGVERGEGAPLSHLTASRAKAPRRRPPSSQHLRHHAAGINASQTFSNVPSTLLVLYIYIYRVAANNVLFSATWAEILILVP